MIALALQGPGLEQQHRATLCWLVAPLNPSRPIVGVPLPRPQVTSSATHLLDREWRGVEPPAAPVSL